MKCPCCKGNFVARRSSDPDGIGCHFCKEKGKVNLLMVIALWIDVLIAWADYNFFWEEK